MIIFSSLEDSLFKSLKADQNVSISVTRKKSGDDLCDRIKTQFPDLKDKILYVNGDDVNNEKTKILLNNDQLKHYKVLIITPKIVNGVSIDLSDHFDCLFVIAETMSCNMRDVCQMIKRVRRYKSNVMHLYVSNSVNPSYSLTYESVSLFRI